MHKSVYNCSFCVELRTKKPWPLGFILAEKKNWHLVTTNNWYWLIDHRIAYSLLVCAKETFSKLTYRITASPPCAQPVGPCPVLTTSSSHTHLSHPITTWSVIVQNSRSKRIDKWLLALLCFSNASVTIQYKTQTDALIYHSCIRTQSTIMTVSTRK